MLLVVPPRYPQDSSNYFRLIGSMWSILMEEPLLRRRALCQALCMGAFGVFWTSIALRLSAPFSLDQMGIAAFALAGAAGAVVAPIAGRAGDRGLTRGATILAHIAVIGAMALAMIGGSVLVQAAPVASPNTALAILIAAAVITWA